MSSSTNKANAQAAGSPDQNESTGYQAPYNQIDPPFQDHYIITFKPGHTLAKHFTFLGKEIELEGTLDEGYYAKLDRELFEAVQRDQGIKLIEDDTLGWCGPTEEELEQARRRSSRRLHPTTPPLD